MLTDQLVAYYKLDEASGNAADSVGSVTLTNTGTATYGAGKINNGVNLARASSQRLNAADPSAFHLSSITLAGWFKLASNPSGSYYTLICKVYGGSWASPYASFYIRLPSLTDIEIGNTFNGSSLDAVGITVSALSTGVWYHVALTYDAGTGSRRLYLNGSDVGGDTKSGNIQYSTGEFNLGRTGDSGEGLDGSLDEWGIWSRALSSAEITSLYNGGTGVQYPFTTPYNTKPSMLGVF